MHMSIKENLVRLQILGKYIEYLNKKFVPKLEKLHKKGYNIENISKYATDQLKKHRYDETYTEYRVKNLLK